MYHKARYWYFKNAVDDLFIKSLHKLIKGQKSHKGTISGISNPRGKNKKLVKEKRESDVKFISVPWLYDAIGPYVKRANTSANWNYDFNWCETPQYTIYKKGQYYGWHIDMADEPYKLKDPNFKGKVRKLSCTLLLNDSSEYKGGGFEFDFRNAKNNKNIVKVKELKNKGDLIVFPSHAWHRVKQVTEGKRLSLVLWFIGPPFK